MRHLLILITLLFAMVMVGHCGPDKTGQDAAPGDAQTQDRQTDQSTPDPTSTDQTTSDKAEPTTADTSEPTIETTPQEPPPGTDSQEPPAGDTGTPDLSNDAGNGDSTSQEPTTDAGPADSTSDGTGADAPPADKAPTLLPAFIAQGDIGRTTISCDDGKTWKANRSWELEGDAAVCGKKAKTECYNLPCEFMNKGTCAKKTPCDCDHHPGAPQGMAYGNGWFVGTWGWGPPGSVRRSADGIKWEKVIDGTTYGGIGFGAGVFVTGDRQPKVSSNNGKTWQDGGKADLKDSAGTVWNVRSFAYVNVGSPGGRFVVTGESGEKRDLLLSADNGKTWVRPTKFDRLCASGVRGIAGGKNIIIILSRTGHVCYSTDAGKTFTRQALPASPSSKPIWDGKKFHFWRRGEHYSSSDAKTWTMDKLKFASGSGTVDVGAIERSADTGTYVAVRGGWSNWYSKQEFYRSTDGITWTRLASGQFDASHRIRHIRFGYVKPSAKGCQ